jgi:hypothetical protein
MVECPMCGATPNMRYALFLENGSLRGVVSLDARRIRATAAHA